MKLIPVNIDDFVSLLRTCAGKVSLITAEGDRLIANGLLTAVIGLSSVFAVARSQEVSIECEIPEDRLQIERFLADEG